jgi:hypothetical protein
MVAQTREVGSKHQRELIGTAEAVVRGAGPKEIVAFLMAFNSRYFRSTLSADLDVRHDLLEVKNRHHTVIFLEFKTAPFANRTFLSMLVWKKLSNAPPTYIWVGVPVDRHAQIAPHEEAHAVRAKGSRCLRLTALANDVTRLEYACTLDLRGQLPTWLTETIALPELMKTPLEIQAYFLQIRRPEMFNAEDGDVLGHMLMDAARGKRGPHLVAAVTKCGVRTAVLHQGKLAEWVGPMVLAIAQGWQGAMLGNDVSSPLAQLSPSDGTSIGRGFVLALATNATVSAAIDEWHFRFPAMREACAQFPWFMPMMEVIGLRCLLISSWGAVFRTALSVVLTYLDIGSDLYAVYTFRVRLGQDAFSYAMLGIIGFQLTMQLVLAAVQHHRNAHAMLWEMLLAVICAKPIVGAVRLMHREPQQVHHLMHPELELHLSRSFEVVFGSLPSGALQLCIFLLNRSRSAGQAVSIAISALTAGFTCANVAMTLDRLPSLRAAEREFFGISPDDPSRRALMLVLSTVASGCKMLAISLAVALFVVAECGAVVGGIYAARVAFAFAAKAARADLACHWPTRAPATQLFSILSNVVNILVVDFCDFTYSRHPYHQGAVLWWVGVLWPWPLLFAGIAVYTSLEHPLASADMVSPLMLWVFGGLLALACLCSHVGFGFTCRRDRLRTFFNTETAAQYTKRVKWVAADEITRGKVLTQLHPSCCRLFIDDAQDWLETNWPRWVQEKPSWFTDRWKGALPDQLLTPALKATLGGSGRRRSTVAEALAGEFVTSNPSPSPGARPQPDSRPPSQAEQ